MAVAGVTCVHFGLSFLSINLLVFLHKGVVFLRYYLPDFFCSFSNNRSMCAWRNLNSTPYVFTGDGLKHQPVPDLTLGTPFKAPEGLAARLCWFLGLPINKAYFFHHPECEDGILPEVGGYFFYNLCCLDCSLVLYPGSFGWLPIVGYTFEIPDAVMGLTLVAFGSSVPDCSSSLFIARKGKLYDIWPRLKMFCLKMFSNCTQKKHLLLFTFYSSVTFISEESP